MKTARFLRAAEFELEDILVFYTSRSKRVGTEFRTLAKVAVSEIEQHPKRWPRLHGEVRHRVLRRFPYHIIYREDPSEVLIIAIAHFRRRPFYWLGRI